MCNSIQLWLCGLYWKIQYVCLTACGTATAYLLYLLSGRMKPLIFGLPEKGVTGLANK